MVGSLQIGGGDGARPRGDLQPVEILPQRRGVAIADVAQHRNDEPVLRVDGDAEIDPRRQAPDHGPAVIAGVQRRHRGACGSDGADEADADIGAGRPPGLDIGLVPERGGHDLRTGARHVERHRTPHPRERLARRRAAGSGHALHIGAHHRAARAAAGELRQIDAALTGQRPHSRRGEDLSRGRCCRRRRCRRGPGRKLADDGAGVGVGAVLEVDQRRTHLDALAGLGEQARDASGSRRRHLDHRLFGLDRDQRLVGDDMIAFGDVPGDDLRLLQPFAEIGEREAAHA